MPEKRRIKRHLKRLKLRYGIDQPVKLAFTEDISLTGLFIKSYDVIKPGSIIVAEVYLTDDIKVMLKGCVMWTKKLPPALVGQVHKAGMGIKIIEFLSDGESVWREFIASGDNLQKACAYSAAGDEQINKALNPL